MGHGLGLVKMRAMRVYSLHGYSSRCIHTKAIPQALKFVPKIYKEMRSPITNYQMPTPAKQAVIMPRIYKYVTVTLHETSSYVLSNPVGFVSFSCYVFGLYLHAILHTYIEDTQM